MVFRPASAQTVYGRHGVSVLPEERIVAFVHCVMLKGSVPSMIPIRIVTSSLCAQKIDVVEMIVVSISGPTIQRRLKVPVPTSSSAITLVVNSR